MDAKITIMDMVIKAATPAEQLYACDQSTKITALTGSLGCLRGDMSGDGEGFNLSWENCRSDLKTHEFQAEFVEVLDTLRYDEQCCGVLRDRKSLTAYCKEHPESDMGRYDREFAFRLDTAQYSYLIRLCLDRIEFDFEIYPYRRDLLDRHMEQAEKVIRFIAPNSKETFRIPDGDRIRIITGSGDTRDRIARYVDEYHVELFTDYDSRLYHVYDFTEQAERTNSKIIPLRSSLPEKCFSITSAADEVVIITKGEMSHRLAGAHAEGVTAREGATAANEAMGVTRAQEAAMLFGSIYGWNKPGADPNYYNEQGEPIKFKHRDHNDAR